MDPVHTFADISWVLFCAAMVFLMQLGFLCLETGLTRNKNNINVATKNISDFAAAVVLYWLVGFGIMFGASRAGLFGQSDFVVDFGQVGAWRVTFFVYQTAFCGAAVTILSGAVAERMVFQSYLCIAVLVSALIYPVSGHWAWNGFGIGEANGWLAERGFIDFAGSTVVHSVGGWVALATCIIIGPRMGKYDDDGSPRMVPASNLPMATLGVLILWIGWIGFNGGSVLSLDDSVPGIIANTMLAGSAGLLAAVAIGRVFNRKYHIEHAMNGSLAGLVAITASCFAVSAIAAAVIGAVGAVVMLSTSAILERLKIDDAVGAIPVHLGAGIWGTLAVGFFGDLEKLGTDLDRSAQIVAQATGIVSIGVWAFGVAYIVLRIIGVWMRLRVSADDEHIGLNVSEHGARTDLIDLFEIMDAQSNSSDLSLRAPVEPFTETGRIASRYNELMESLQSTVADLTATTAAKERMQSELRIGHDIQMSMLPLMFPMFPEREEFSIFAAVQPSREVGGDFYDIFFIDDNQLCVTIADVSGKGVPAALFMAVSKSVLKSLANKSFSTASIVNQANREIARENTNYMFVTSFLAILDIKTGVFVYTNAGHNPPFIIRSDQSIEKLEERHGIPIGIQEDNLYKESRLELNSGDTLFLYTDGVTEAMNPQKELFGEERLASLCSKSAHRSAEELIHTVVGEVRTFEEGAEQSDDVSVLALQYLGAPEPESRQTLTVSIANRLEEIATVVQRLAEFAQRFHIPKPSVQRVNVVLDELLNNVISYGFRDQAEHHIDLQLELYSDRLRLTLKDDGIPFNPFAKTESKTEENKSEDYGGRGIFLVRNLMNKVGYQRQEGKNVVSMVKYLDIGEAEI